MGYHLSVMPIRAVKVECSGPKPDWNLASKLFSSNKYLYVWLKIALSKSLAITERTEMGL